jgi:predicted enzyme related to lactoylglutathione lyase
MTSTIRFSHVGICVRDMTESVRFYTEALGFTLTERYRMGDSVAALSEVTAPIALEVQFMRKDNAVVELLRWELPGTEGEPARRFMNQLGLTHLAISVADVDDALDRITRHGGTVHQHTRVIIPEGDHIYCTDPNGVRIEVIQTTDAGWYDRLH